METNQLDSILQASAAFLTTVFFTPKIQAGSIQILPLRILIIISRELPAFLPTQKFVITSKAVHLLFVLLKLRPPELFLVIKSLPFASFTIWSHIFTCDVLLVFDVKHAIKYMTSYL